MTQNASLNDLKCWNARFLGCLWILKNWFISTDTALYMQLYRYTWIKLLFFLTSASLFHFNACLSYCIQSIPLFANNPSSATSLNAKWTFQLHQYAPFGHVVHFLCLISPAICFIVRKTEGNAWLIYGNPRRLHMTFVSLLHQYWRHQWPLRRLREILQATKARCTQRDLITQIKEL